MPCVSHAKPTAANIQQCVSNVHCVLVFRYDTTMAAARARRALLLIAQYNTTHNYACSTLQHIFRVPDTRARGLARLCLDIIALYCALRADTQQPGRRCTYAARLAKSTARPAVLLSLLPWSQCADASAVRGSDAPTGFVVEN